jgi:pyruvate formate lyase activating enzyme
MHVKGWARTSLVDYPEKIAASLFCGGCNFRCPNCHNSDLVLRPQSVDDIPEHEVWAFLESRVGLLDGVVLSGGEPTLQRDLLDFALRLRRLGYKVKLDTNGYRPRVVQAMMDQAAVDYVAMDVKAPLVSARYTRAVGIAVDVDRIRRTVELLLAGRVDFEFRTTVVPGLLDETDIVDIAKTIEGATRFFLQQFVARNTLDPQMLSQVPYPADRLRAMAELARPWAKFVGIRGI